MKNIQIYCRHILLLQFIFKHFLKLTKELIYSFFKKNKAFNPFLEINIHFKSKLQSLFWCGTIICYLEETYLKYLLYLLLKIQFKSTLGLTLLLFLLLGRFAKVFEESEQKQVNNENTLDIIHLFEIIQYEGHIFIFHSEFLREWILRGTNSFREIYWVNLLNIWKVTVKYYVLNS